MPARIDLTNYVFGRLTVVHSAGQDKNGLYVWLCRCVCGSDRIVRGQDLRRGKQISCGCHKSDQLYVRNLKHGAAGTRPYRIWKGMKSRCLNPRVSSFIDYGGRGIKICERWVNSFEAFWADMKTGYADNLEIDRIDHNGNYEPTNCRWVSKSTQNRNTRQNHYVDTPFGRITIAEFSERTGIEYDKIKRNIYSGATAYEILEKYGGGKLGTFCGRGIPSN